MGAKLSKGILSTSCVEGYIDYLNKQNKFFVH